MVYITHSIPEMHGLMIRTPSGNIFHTGDWKLDSDPVVGEPTDENKLTRLRQLFKYLKCYIMANLKKILRS